MFSVLCIMVAEDKSILYKPADENSSTLTIFNKNGDDQTCSFSLGYWNMTFIIAAGLFLILAANSVECWKCALQPFKMQSQLQLYYAYQREIQRTLKMKNSSQLPQHI